MHRVSFDLGAGTPIAHTTLQVAEIADFEFDKAGTCRNAIASLSAISGEGLRVHLASRDRLEPCVGSITLAAGGFALVTDFAGTDALTTQHRTADVAHVSRVPYLVHRGRRQRHRRTLFADEVVTDTASPRRTFRTDTEMLEREGAKCLGHMYSAR